MDYRSAGVDLERAERTTESLRALVASTRDEHTLSELGLFGGLYRVPPGHRKPVLVSSADGVGTKLKVAFRTGRHDTVGQDLVNHCVNDILVQGARPLFFLDYLATGRLEEEVAEEVVRGVATACRENECALLGGETAEMPDFYAVGEYDLAGFIVGIVEEDHVLDGGRIRPGDRLVGLDSSGLHTNGYTLARRIVFERMGLSVDDPFPGEDASVGETLLRVHRSYLGPLRSELTGAGLRGLAHITGGGIPGNLARILPEGTGARVDLESWTVPNVFRVMASEGGVEPAEMRRAFNMGVGMIAVVEEGETEPFVERLRSEGEDAWVLGEVVKGNGVRFH